MTVGRVTDCRKKGEISNPMKTNYHSHTHRCRHAAKGERGYVESALSEGFRILGFADHVPQPFKGTYYSGMRMRPEETEDYVATLAALKHEYRGEIDIHIGFEAEYYPALFDDLLRLLEPTEYEYLILGQHFLGNEEGESYMGVDFDSEATLTRYVDQCSKALETGAFSCFAHPDIPHFHGSDNVYRAEMRRLCRNAHACRIPLEFNLLGYGTGRHYPASAFWEEAAAVGNKVILGWDAHDPAWFAQPALEAKAIAYLDSLGMTRIECLTLTRPRVR